MTYYQNLPQQNQPYDFNQRIGIQLYPGNYVTNYDQLMRSHNVGALANTIREADKRILEMPVYMFIVSMMPQNIQWLMWKGNQEIAQFLTDITDQIEQMRINKFLSMQNSQKIQQVYFELKKITMDANGVKLFTQFLNLLADNEYMKKTEQFLIFVNHCVPLDKWQMKIYKQFYVYKSPSVFDGFLTSSKKKEGKRDFFITLTAHGILKSDNHLQQSRIRMMIPFTNQLTIQSKKLTSQKYICFVLQSCEHQQLVVNFYNDYIESINFMVALTMALDDSSYSIKDHRFLSYAIQRSHCAGKLYVDGAQYYQDLYDQLITAKWQVCITGWMITPYFLLKRPNKIDSKEFRLDGVLETLARRGVKVYIIVFMQPKMFVNNDSEHVQIYLESLHDNIKVYRHPNDTIPLLWSHHQKMVVIDQQIGFMGGLDICYGRWDNCVHDLSYGVDPNNQLPFWDGADYNNYRTRDITQPRKFLQSNINKQFQPRMPWHDIALQFRGDIVIDLLRHFVQYWYFVKAQLNIDPAKGLNFLKRRYQQAFYDRRDTQQAQYYLVEIKKREQVESFGQKLKYMFNGRAQRYPQLLIQNNTGKKVGHLNMQMCRSASDWSIGVRGKQPQKSIHNAYVELIKNAQKFIYIENQFFMGLKNQVVQRLSQKIIQCHQKRQPFRLIVVMPLLPGFQGNIGDPASTVLRIQVHYQYQAINRSASSLFQRLKTAGIGFEEASRYVHFFGLRQSGLVSGTPLTQIIYVHSKLMIVDDTRCIIGSANINDRSLEGNRDSQLACVIQEPTNAQSTGCIFDLRARIFAEHFGLTKQNMDILNDNVWNSIISNSQRATLFYRKTFGCIPDDLVTQASQIQALEKKANISLYQYKQNQVVAHAVEFPLEFMKNQDLTFKLGQKQYFAPQYSFT